MDAAADRPEFAPPPQGGLLGGLVIALLAHLLLMLALTWGIQWNRDSQDLAAEAELWSSVPQQAAPKPVVAPPPPPAPPVVKEEPKPEPKPQPPDINVQREKELREAQARRKAELAEERLERERERKKAAAEKEQKRKEQEKLAAENRRKEAEAKERREKQEAERMEKEREDRLQRLRGMAGSSPTATPGTAAQSSGPSASWAGRVRARVKPNIVFTDDVPGNPTAEVEVRLAPDGTIVSRRLLKPSGHRGWDEAVLRALDKTEVLPRDTDGRVPPSGVLVFRAKD